MKKYISILILVLLGSGSALAQVRVLEPAKGKYATSFAIIIDQASFEAAQNEVLQYKATLENEGLATYVVSAAWSSPEAVKAEIAKIAASKPPLEGVVFIGRVPVVRVRNAQHLTSAFKMDEVAFPMEESSVTSDRYYDNPHMRFERITQDKEDSNIYYYKLLEDSPQRLAPAFYSARMLPPSDQGQDGHALLRRYLQKVVAAHQEQNPLDNLVVFAGHGYNSDCLTAWGDEPLAMREYFPAAFASSRQNAFYNFRQDPVFREHIYTQLLRKEVDVFLFHEHGAFDTQYINGSYPASRLDEYMEQTGILLRNEYRRRSGQRAEDFLKSVIEEYRVPASWFEARTLDSLRLSDSIAKAAVNIKLEDLAKITAHPRFSIFDACYNASFHQKGYVAGYHIFGDGNTVVSQGNTVNVLQDKWSTELLGLLSKGLRVGFWHNQVMYLETHLVGDPTFRFLPADKDAQALAAQLSADIVLKKQDTKLWQSYLSQDDPTLQAIALRKLAPLRPAGFAQQVLNLYHSTPYHSLRMSCVKVLNTYPAPADPHYASDLDCRKQILAAGINDPYELVRRLSANYAGSVGDPSLITPLVLANLHQMESQRVGYQSQSVLSVFEQDAVTKAYLIEADAFPFMEGEALHSLIKRAQESATRRQQNAVAVIGNKTAALKDRIQEIRFLRNYNRHYLVPKLLNVLQDPTEDALVRVTLAEALGWFDTSIALPVIIKGMQETLRHKNLPAELRAEIVQSLHRLQ